MTFPATPYAEVMSGGQPESLRAGVCGFPSDHTREIPMTKERFIGGKVRIAKGKLLSGTIVIEVKEARTARVSTVLVSAEEAVRLVAALANAISQQVR